MDLVQQKTQQLLEISEKRLARRIKHRSDECAKGNFNTSNLDLMIEHSYGEVYAYTQALRIIKNYTRKE